MTIAEIGDFVKNTAARNRGRGGNSMNLISVLLMKLDFNNKRRKYEAEANKYIDDYGYVLYKSLEDDFKYLKKNDLGLRDSLINTTIR